MQSYHDVIVRGITVSKSKASFVYITDREHTRSGTSGIDLIIVDRIFHVRDTGFSANYRLIVRNAVAASACHDQLSEFYDEGNVYYWMRPYFSRTRTSRTITIMKYADDTLTAPIDIPYDDPLVKKMKTWFDRGV